MPTTAQISSQPAFLPSGVLQGPAALARVGNGLEQLAADSNLTPAELRTSLLEDESLWLAEDGRLFFVDAAAPASGDDDEPGSYEGGIPTGDAFLLHSNPGASKTIYLDFTGHHSVNNQWGHNIQFPPYNTSGSSATFSNGELNDIIRQWEYVVEDFKPFDVDVTTEEPPLSALTKSNGGDTTYGVRCLMTQYTDGFGNGSGGIAFLNSFNDSTDNPVFAFNKGVNTGSMTASHEVGHALGLSHDGLNGSTYHPGSGSGETGWGPIMGAPFGKNLVQWSDGNYSGATTSQNDIQIIINGSNGINKVDDDFGDDNGSATPVPPPPGCPTPGGPGTIAGVIERRLDVDVFSFSTGGGFTTVQAVPRYAPGGNTDLRIELFDAGGVPIGSDDSTNQSDATLGLELTAGTYYIHVDGVGKEGVYDDYGSLGQYNVNVFLPSTTSFTVIPGAVAGSGGAVPLLQTLGTPCAGSSITLNIFSAPSNALTYECWGVAQLGLPFKGGVLVPDVLGAGGLLLVKQTNSAGWILNSLTWPAGLPPATTLYVQSWFKDAGNPAGFAATDGVAIYAP